jgi:hypothetical protein
MEKVPENGKESLNSAHAIGMNEMTSGTFCMASIPKAMDSVQSNILIVNQPLPQNYEFPYLLQ